MNGRKLVLIMVGLPARGKTFLSVRLQRYLEWQGYRAGIFNVGTYRRALLGPDTSRSDFFDPTVKEYARERERVAKACFADMARWLESDGDVGIYDATNVTPSRRAYLREASARRGFDCVFVENVCDDQETLERIVGVKISKSVDYRGRDPEKAGRDFRERIRHYKSVYEPVSDDVPNIRTVNFGAEIFRGFDTADALLTEIADFLGSINLAEKDVFITRHGQTFFNLEDRIGGDSSLTERGVEYARALAEYFKGRDLVVFTSTRRRTMETAGFLERDRVELAELDEIESGVCDGMTYEEIAREHPEINGGREKDKLRFRYPGGESYLDLIRRVRGALVKIESRKKDVLVIAHRAVNRCLFSYYVPTRREEIPYLGMPLRRVVRAYPRKALYDYEEITL